VEQRPDAGDSAGLARAKGSADDPHAQRFIQYENAAQLAVLAHPLPGEDLDTTFVDDAHLWLRVYTELLEFKETLMRDTEHALRTIAEAGREEVARTDAVILKAEAQRFRHRLALWKNRCEELTRD
jgi:hypothetical protein